MLTGLTAVCQWRLMGHDREDDRGRLGVTGQGRYEEFRPVPRVCTVCKQMAKENQGAAGEPGLASWSVEKMAANVMCMRVCLRYISLWNFIHCA